MSPPSSLFVFSLYAAQTHRWQIKRDSEVETVVFSGPLRSPSSAGPSDPPSLVVDLGDTRDAPLARPPGRAPRSAAPRRAPLPAPDPSPTRRPLSLISVTLAVVPPPRPPCRAARSAAARRARPPSSSAPSRCRPPRSTAPHSAAPPLESAGPVPRPVAPPPPPCPLARRFSLVGADGVELFHHTGPCQIRESR
ncbi:unnamed protein product [Linum trigynum]|uniref:Uncharacterized protein n=1 Tax=Linum trigynum TaxID=586398 RepID=A0AAV2F3M6_9ROSI